MLPKNKHTSFVENDLELEYIAVAGINFLCKAQTLAENVHRVLTIGHVT